MFLLSNHTVNRKNAQQPYNETGHKAKQNDEFYMEYIDIDTDDTTFSSSSADLWLENDSGNKLLFAGLYWSGIYKYDSGRLKNKKFVIDNSNRDVVNRVKIKLPQSENYIDVEGEIIFDSYLRKQFTSNMPYAVFADITDQVKNLSAFSGTYTVANVRATQGTLSGGVAAGWALVLVFENKNNPYRHFSIYDGFVEAKRQPVDISFHDFQTPPEGQATATIFGAALEGDLNMNGDRLLFKTNTTTDFTELGNSIRSKNNFFNSSITTDNSYTNNRNPNSVNTLGYDAFSMEIENPGNSVIGNNATQATLRIQSYADRLYFFMSAFFIDVVETEKETISVMSDLIEKEITVLAVEEKENQTENLIVMETEAFFDEEETPPIKIFKISDIAPGYYLIVNVFAKPDNAFLFISTLKNRELYPKFFINPENNYHYVYLEYFADYEQAATLYKSRYNRKYTEDMWIMKIEE